MGSPYTTVPVGQGHTQTPVSTKEWALPAWIPGRKDPPGEGHMLLGCLVLPLKHLIKILLLTRAGSSKRCTILYTTAEVGTDLIGLEMVTVKINFIDYILIYLFIYLFWAKNFVEEAEGYCKSMKRFSLI